MAKARYYSPRLDRDLITRLYHQARTERVPMTALASRLIREGLGQKECASGAVVAEEPPAHDPGGRKN
ncbi:MAG: hypothetical protein ABJF10_30260 [Chthoniobacter sp.]|uniref:hypothetical protein n=1 Tax=Chthoniobacter sp. TaxID=2510640 RepID=UPI0032ABAB15